MKINYPKFMRQVTAMKYLDLPRSTWYDLKAKGILPKPIKTELGERYLKDDLDEFMLKNNSSKSISSA